jgi:Uma2 family endonuclease
MTMAPSVPRVSWTVDDLERMPADDPNRYEIVDGNLIVTPPMFVPHGMAIHRLRQALERSAPPEFLVITEAVGLMVGPETFLIPDLVVVSGDPVERKAKYLDPADVYLVAEVLSPTTRRIDRLLKRGVYAECGIEQYWIVDSGQRAITVLTGTGYRDERVLRPGATWRTDRPYPIDFDPADVV